MKIPAIPLILSVGLLAGCNTLKEAQVDLASGNYEEAIKASVEKLRKGRAKKKSVEYMLILEDAFAKAVDQDTRSINRMDRESGVDALKEVYHRYQSLHERQEYIRPLLPLYIPETGRETVFLFKNYDDALYASKMELSDHVYDHAANLLRRGDKIDARVAYDNFKYLNDLNPRFKDTSRLIDEAHHKGTDFVFVQLLDQTGYVNSRELESDLLFIDTRAMNNLWNVYHNAPVEGIEYDFELTLVVRDIQISPEQTHDKEVIKEKKIRDGYDYDLDENGNVRKDEHGNDIKSDRYITVRSRIQEFTQLKSAQIVADVEYKSYRDNQFISSVPLTSEYVFTHRYGTHSGDRRALDSHSNGLLGRTIIPFPTDAEMIYRTGENLKRDLKDVVANLF